MNTAAPESAKARRGAPLQDDEPRDKRLELVCTATDKKRLAAAKAATGARSVNALVLQILRGWLNEHDLEKLA